MHRPKPQNLWNVTRETFANWSKHEATTHSAAIAYLSLFSLAPLLILVIAVSGWAFGAEAARGEIQRVLGRFIGTDAAAAIQQLVARQRPARGRAGSPP